MLPPPPRSTLFPYTTLFRSLTRTSTSSMARRPWVTCSTTGRGIRRSEEHTSELQSRVDLVCRLLLEKKKKDKRNHNVKTSSIISPEQIDYDYRKDPEECTNQ